MDGKLAASNPIAATPAARPAVAARTLSPRAAWRLAAVSVVLLSGLLLGGLAYGFIHSAARVTVSMDSQPATVFVHEATVGELLDEMRISLRPEDRLSPPRSAAVQPDMQIVIERARPVLIDDGGRLQRLYTHATAVQEVLADLSIAVSAHDVLTMAEQPTAPDAALAPLVLDRGQNFPGVPGVYPWSDTQPAPLMLAVRYAVPLAVQINGATDTAAPADTIWSTASTVGEALAGLGIALYEGDLVQPALGEPLTVDRAAPERVRTITIERSKPVEIATANHALRTRSRGATVADLLSENGLMLTGFDRIEPALDTPLTADISVRIIRVQHTFEIEEQVTPYESVIEADPDLEIDNQRLEQEGVNGITRQRYRIVLEDGVPVSRALDDSWLAQAPVTRVNTYGVKIVPRQLSTPGGTVTYWRKIRMFATSYTPADAGTPLSSPWYGLTRTGMQAGYGVVAVDPSVVSLYTQVYVPGYGQAVAGDTGGGVVGRWIDLGYNNGTMVNWGRCIDVYLLGSPPAASQINYRLPSTPSVGCGW